MVIPVAAPFVRRRSVSSSATSHNFLQKDYASQIVDRLSALGLYADVDNSDNTLPKKIRNGEIAQYNFILGECSCYSRSCAQVEQHLVVGEAELNAQSVNVRNRDDVETKAKGQMVPLEEIVTKFVELKKSRRVVNQFA